MKKKRMKRERKELLRHLDEMLEILDGAKTPIPDPGEAYELPPLKFILDLRNLHYKATGRQPKHVNVDPETEAAILMSRAFSAMEWMTTDPVRIHLYGMEWHTLEPGRLPWEMW